MGIFKQKYKERRKYPRINDSLEINYQIPDEPIHLGCHSIDISEGGIRIGLYQELKPGTSFKLGIYFPEMEEPLWLLGKVAWIRRALGKEYLYEAGIEFQGLDFSLRSKIQDHIKIVKSR